MNSHFVTSLLAFFLTSLSFAQSVLTIHGDKPGTPISKAMYGLFFEEINHAGDGGLYAELVRNRSFEDNDRTAEAWRPVGAVDMQLITKDLLNPVQTKALRLTAKAAPGKNQPVGVVNEGYWGIHAVKNRVYTLSFWARTTSGNVSALTVALVSKSGETRGSVQVRGIGPRWKKFETILKAVADDSEAELAVYLPKAGSVDLDMVSLFPPTFNNRKNGLRPDLAQLLFDTKPAFIRFPGGCYVEGDGAYEHAFQWKKTIGPIEQRPGHWNRVWGYRSTDGLGYDEYLQMCEDMNAEALFVVNIGLGHRYLIPLDSLAPLVQNTLEAIEYAIGDEQTPMGRLRAKNGHPAPYKLRYIELGNENYQREANQTSQNYAERYAIFRKAIIDRFPNLLIVGNVEAWGTDTPSWRNEHPVDVVDEHYYRSHSWMRDNFNKYDAYSRNEPKIYVGEYAANAHGTYGKNGTIQSALGEAIFMMGMERNADVCVMSSFAPIFTHERNRAWDYDMIHFTASQAFVTPSYYVQKLFAHHLGARVLPVTESNNLLSETGKTRMGIGTWKTEAQFSDFAVLDGEYHFLAKETYSAKTEKWQPVRGNWTVAKMAYCQTSADENCTSIYQQDFSLSDYEINVNARKQSGDEGFLILFNYRDSDNYCWWNIGGWGNTASALECCVDGHKTTYGSTPFKVKSGETYQLRLKVKGNVVEGIINGEVILRTTMPQRRAVYACAALNDDATEVIVKLVNPEATSNNVVLNFSSLEPVSGKVVQLKATQAADENTLEQPDLVKPEAEKTLDGVAPKMTFQAPPFSLNILRLKLRTP